MNKKIKRIFAPNTRFYFIVILLCAAVTFFLGDYNKELAVIEVGVAVILFAYSGISNDKRSKELLKYVENISYDVDTATKDTLLHFPLPMVIFTLEDSKMIYTNNTFLDMTGEKERFFEKSITDVIPDFSPKWLMEGKSESPDLVSIGDKRYRVYGSLVRTERTPGSYSYLATTYWADVTEFATIAGEFQLSRPVFSIILMDNYEELLKGLPEKDKSAVLASLDDKISEWAADSGGYLCKYDRDRYIFIFEDRHLPGLIENKFSLLDKAKEVTVPGGTSATISIGIGKDGKSFLESFQYASLGIEMALSRGGDQAVIRNRYNFEFYGGHSSQIEKRTKVKSRVIANSMSELIRDSSGVYVMGHKHSDLDSVGAAVGVVCAARKIGKPAYIVLDRHSTAAKMLVERMETLPEYKDVFIAPQEAIVRADGGSLLVVVDTNRPEQVESEDLLVSCNRVAVIDHHRRAATYIQNAALSFHEPYASSAAELVTEILQYIADPADILRLEAEALLAGIVLDTKNFTLRTGGRTFEAAAFLRRSGADTSEVKRLQQSDIKTAMSRYAIIQRAKVYKAGIAIAAIDSQENRIIAAQAADELLNISGIRASFVVFREEEAVNISARSIDDINVQMIVEKLGGGGNRSAAGVQLRDRDVKQVVTELLEVIDKYLEDASE